MKKELESVKLFHKKFNIDYLNEPKANIPDEIKELRFKLMEEENLEYLKATKENDIVEIADALGDMLYILCGTIISHGLQNKIEEIFQEIQNSNMSKLGDNGKPIYRDDGKVLKGPNYFKPDIRKILKL
ncbi:nucleoside triphosphate pyrophosphohydrolase family protein [bacterium]|nr:nucleoside triphosphate pyrophosphohydrolase family protein [Bacteroidota bacterium]MDC3064189.1 nucleoside triphosphate pyrophosphohydrolase family protein [bacterium]